MTILETGMGASPLKENPTWEGRVNKECYPTLCSHRGKGFEREVTGLSECPKLFNDPTPVAHEAAGISALP